MNTRATKRVWLDWFGLLARWLVGGLFIWMGLNKALHPEDFLKLVHQYDLLQSPLLLNLVGAGLPWFEVFCGILLLLGVAVRGTAAVCLLMLLPFTAIVLRRALELSAARHLPFCAVKFDCGCGNGEVFICSKLLENSALILACFVPLLGFGTLASLRFHLLKPPLQQDPDKLEQQVVAQNPN
jgi:uncharacterized membrane protein YphA (DoxX/SURF4 family)